MAFTRDGKKLLSLFTEVHRLGRGKQASKEYSEVVQLWDLDDASSAGKRVFETAIGHTGIWTIKLSPDGSTLALVAANRILFLDSPAWRVRDGGVPNTWDDNYATDAAFSPDGSTLATLGRLGAQLRDVKTGRLRVTLPLKGRSIGSHGIMFSPNGKYLAACCAEGLVVWYLFSNEPVKVLKQPHPRRIHSDPLVYSPDGAFLVAGYTDGTFHVWKTSDFRERMIVNADRKGITALAFSPDGKTLASGGYEHKIKLWDVAELPSKFGDRHDSPR